MTQQRLILIRGLPGSGKSTLAKSLNLLNNFAHYEADMYFLKNEVYTYRPENIAEAHSWCRYNTFKSLREGRDVIVSNTFTRQKELVPYQNMSLEFGITPCIILCQSSFGSIHNVSDEVFVKMKNRFQYDLCKLDKVE